MKKIKFCLVAAVLSLMLCGCGMEGDGYVTDTPQQTQTPIESPYIKPSPLPTERPEGTDRTDGAVVDETPAPGNGTTNETRR